MSEPLKPCPACGGEAMLGTTGRHVYCTACDMRGPSDDRGGVSWNHLPRRTDAKAPAGMSDGELQARVALCSMSEDDAWAFNRECGVTSEWWVKLRRSVHAELARREKERQT